MHAGRRAPAPLAVAVVLALLGGYVTRLGFPSPGWWPLAAVGVALWCAALAGRSLRAGAGLGLIYGLAFFVPLLHWSGVYVGAVPWLALATLEALYLAVLGLALSRVLPRPGTRVLPAVAGTACAAALWVGEEALRDRTPFGGFPWGRLAFSQADAPTAHLASLAGAPLVTFAVAWSGALLGWAALVAVGRRGTAVPRPRLARAGAAALAAAAASTVGFAVPLPGDGTPVRVAGVQGDVPAPGLDFNAERRAVLDDHARETGRLAQRVAAGTAPRPDVVIWPENSSDLDPYREVDAREVIDDAVDGIGVPTLVGAVLQRDDGRLTNASIVWTPGQGPGATYAKRHPVPFGEYIPYRSFFRRLSSKVDLVSADFAPGHQVGTLALGRTHVGVSICFEVAYDGLVRDTVRDGADLLVVQTNNATFGYTDEAVQQLAMSRLRAVEHGRAVAHVSTVGVSALIRPDGSTVQTTRLFTPAVLQATLPLRTSLTPADRVGAWPELALALLGLVGAVGSGLLRRRGRRLGSGEPPAVDVADRPLATST